jgi:hypothetical protein
MEDNTSRRKSLEQREGPAVESTRRGLEAMEVVENETSVKASTGRLKGRVIDAARTGWQKVRMMLNG